ncbi:hypothetical protein B0H14DRAFT_3171071 [Mycena olivaceomarginata]|nr:hypothetical protein B0H14DRAFT_3171071 [Mycena olivaceomarginata]
MPVTPSKPPRTRKPSQRQQRTNENRADAAPDCASSKTQQAAAKKSKRNENNAQAAALRDATNSYEVQKDLLSRKKKKLTRAARRQTVPNDDNSEIIPIPKPKGKFNIQEAMGLADDQCEFTKLQAGVHALAVEAKIDFDEPWSKQEPSTVAKLLRVSEKRFPYLTSKRFRGIGPPPRCSNDISTVWDKREVEAQRNPAGSTSASCSSWASAAPLPLPVRIRPPQHRRSRYYSRPRRSRTGFAGPQAVPKDAGQTTRPQPGRTDPCTRGLLSPEGAAKLPVGTASAPTPVWTPPARSGSSLVSSAPPPVPPTYAGGAGHNARADTDLGVAKLSVSVLAVYALSPPVLATAREGVDTSTEAAGTACGVGMGDRFTPATPVSPSHKLPSSKRRTRSSDPPMDDRDRGKSMTRDRTCSTTRHDRALSMAPHPPPLPSLDRSRSLGPRPRTAPPRGDVYGVHQPGPGATPFYPVPVQQQMPYHPRAPGYGMPAPPYPYPQQQPTQNHHMRSRSSSQAQIHSTLNRTGTFVSRFGIQEDEALENATEKLLVWDRRIDDNLMQ